MSKNFTVYLHVFPNQKTYVGITTRKPKERWANGGGYKHQLVYRAINKYGWKNIKHIILAENLDQKEANQAEKDWIKYWDSTNPINGYNCLIGGLDGAVSYKHTPEAKEKIRISSKGRPHIVTESQKKNLSTKIKKLWEDPKYREKHTGNHFCCYEKRKAVLQYDLKGNFLKKWDSQKTASTELNINYNGINNCCKLTSFNSARSIWILEEDFNKERLSFLIKKNSYISRR